MYCEVLLSYKVFFSSETIVWFFFLQWNIYANNERFEMCFKVNNRFLDCEWPF